MIIDQGEKIHYIIRRVFVEDIRRHFIGEVHDVEGDLLRVEGYAFVFDTVTNRYVKRPEKRIRIVSMSDATNIINVLPMSTDIESVEYVQTPDRRLAVTDHKGFHLDINEIGLNL